MAEYIDREAVVKRLEVTPLLQYGIPKEVRDGVIDLIKIQPAADVAPVVHGLWEREPSSYWRWTPSGAVAVTRTTYRCGLCGRRTAVKTNYCPNCGAKMDGGADNAAD